MKLNPKNIVLGGITFYVATMVVSMGVAGPLIHEGLLEGLYDQTAQFWRPELNEDPPNIGALMVRWTTVGILIALVYAGIFDNIRGAFEGGAVAKGAKFGLMLALVGAAFAAAYSGVFNLPDQLWMWWALEGFLVYAVGGAALGFVIGKWGTD